MAAEVASAQRFDDNVLKPWAWRIARLDQIVHGVALALGGRPAPSFARRLSMPISNDTLLRNVRRRGSPSFTPPSVIGIDDWAWRRNQRCGTLTCVLGRRKTIALLPDRESATAQAWLAQPQIGIVARDRGGGYGLAAQKALPNAVPVADRWRLMENASRQSEGMDASALGRAPSARTVAQLMTVGRDQLSKAQTVTVAAVESGKLKLVKRQMYGRERLDLLQARVIGFR